MADAEHEEWLRGEEERKKVRTRAPAAKPPSDDAVKERGGEDEEIQEAADDAADDAVEELQADVPAQDAQEEGDV